MAATPALRARLVPTLMPMPMPWSAWPRNVRLLMAMRAARSVGQGAMVAAFAPSTAAACLLARTAAR